VQTALTNDDLGTESQRYNCFIIRRGNAVQRLKVGNRTTGLPSGRQVSRPRELNITFQPQCKANRTAKLTTINGKLSDKRKWKRQNIIKYSTGNVRGIANREEELDNVLDEKQIKTNNYRIKKVIWGKMETNNYIVTYSGVNKRTTAQSSEIIWIHKSIKNSNYTYWIGTIFEVKLNIGRRKLSFMDST